MFKILKVWDARLYERYLTLEKNVKAKSNSFYDAYLDLLEQFVTYVLTREAALPEKRKTCGELLRQEATREVFCARMGLPLEVYNKMGDYVLKINAHKHKGEKHVQLETVLSYMRLLYGVVARVAVTWGEATLAFDEMYFCNLFGSFERDNQLLWEQLNALRAELEEYATRGMAEEERDAYAATGGEGLAGLALEEQNEELKRQIALLTDIKQGLDRRLSSIEEGQREILHAVRSITQEQERARVATVKRAQPSPPPITLAQFAKGSAQAHIWLGTAQEFENKQKRALILLLSLIGVMVLSTIVTSIGFHIYSTYTFFENIYLILVVCMTIYIHGAKRVYDTATLQNRCMFTFVPTRDGIWRMGNKKTKYKVLLVLSCIGSALNIVCVFGDLLENIKLGFLIVVLELGVLVLSIVANHFASDFFEDYLFVGLKARVAMPGVSQVLIYSPLENKLYTKEDFQKRFASLKLPL